ncbi:MAG TPA: amidohydrolase family protein [Gammaproteobacteria bacterium]|nr:amidohydrolase family protein [Gammaproteobacteria bacterium]
MRRLPLFLLLVVSAARAEVVDITEGTNLSLAADPANDLIVLDLLGGLWRLPIAGGGAIPLLPAGSGAAQPRIDPTGESVVFQRWQDGQWDVWRLTLATGAIEPLTRTAFDEREPDYSPDGSRIVFAGNQFGSYSLFSLALESGELDRLTDEPGDARFPTFDAAGTLAYTSIAGGRSAIRRYTGAQRGETLVESQRRLDAPSWRPGGGVLLVNERVEGESSSLALFIDADEPIWRRLTSAEDVFVGRVAWLSPEEYVYAADGALWRRGIASQTRNRIFVFAAVDVENTGAAPEVGPLDAAGPHPVGGINGLVTHEPTGRAAFTALGDLWLAEGQEIRRLTDDAFLDTEPRFTPDGEWLVFASDRGGDMEIWRYRLDSGQLLQVSEESGRAFEPRVSGDGRYVAWLAADGDSRWDSSSLRLVELERPFESTTLAGGLYSATGLAWQGRDLRLSASDAAGTEAYPHVYETPAGEARAAASPEPDAALLEMLDGAEELQWDVAPVEARYVIQAARLFDGIGSDYRYHVDIHIEGQRITDIVRRGRLPLPERVIDAGELTVVPGLIDVHSHLSNVAGADLGKRWLRSGITTVRDVTPDWREALERAEAWASGQLPGPRLVVAPVTPPPAGSLPAGSPIIAGDGRPVFGGFAHALADQWAREGRVPARLSPVLVGGDTPGLPRVALSTLGRSYGDVIGQIQASGAYFATGLGALDAVAPARSRGGRNDGFDRIMQDTGRIAIGSDAPAVAYGLGFHDELARLAGRGVPPAQVLRYATAGGAIALGLSLQLGTLEPGRLADLIVIDGDPLRNLGDLKRIEAVVTGGVWRDADALVATQ